MGYHHIAIATRDLEATHRFYTGAMGFELVKVVASPTPEQGWARHLFYETGGNGMFAIWDLHDATLPADYPTAISTGLGLPNWVNHIAFYATDLEDIARRRERLREHGLDVAEIDHGWCTSIYATDPNGILVEFCTTTVEFTEEDRAEARALLAAEKPPLEAPPRAKVFRARAAAAARA